MSCTNTPLHNELLGAVIGLARTCANNPKTDDTDRLIFTALRVSANKSANEQTLAAMIRRVMKKKRSSLQAVRPARHAVATLIIMICHFCGMHLMRYAKQSFPSWKMPKHSLKN